MTDFNGAHDLCYADAPAAQVGLHACRNVPIDRRSLFEQLPPHVVEIRVQPYISYHSCPKLEVYRRGSATGWGGTEPH